MSDDTIFVIDYGLRGHAWVKRMPPDHGGLMIDADAIPLTRVEVIALRDKLSEWIGDEGVHCPDCSCQCGVCERTCGDDPRGWPVRPSRHRPTARHSAR